MTDAACPHRGLPDVPQAGALESERIAFVRSVPSAAD